MRDHESLVSVTNRKESRRIYVEPLLLFFSSSGAEQPEHSLQTNNAGSLSVGYFEYIHHNAAFIYLWDVDYTDYNILIYF